MLPYKYAKEVFDFFEPVIMGLEHLEGVEAKVVLGKGNSKVGIRGPLEGDSMDKEGTLGKEEEKDEDACSSLTFQPIVSFLFPVLFIFLPLSPFSLSFPISTSDYFP